MLLHTSSRGRWLVVLLLFLLLAASRPTKNVKKRPASSVVVSEPRAPSLWLLLGIFVQKIFETNLNFRYLPVKNQKIWRQSRYANLKSWSNCLYFFWYFTVLYLKLRFVLKILFGQIFPKSAIVCHRNRGLNFSVFGIRSATGTLSTHGVNTVVFYKTKQKFSCFLEGLKYTKLFCLLWGGWQFRIVNKFLSNYCCLEQCGVVSGAQCVELKLGWRFCVHTSTCPDIYF